MPMPSDTRKLWPRDSPATLHIAHHRHQDVANLRESQVRHVSGFQLVIRIKVNHPWGIDLCECSIPGTLQSASVGVNYEAALRLSRGNSALSGEPLPLVSAEGADHDRGRIHANHDHSRILRR